MPPVIFDRLLPEPGTLAADALVEALELGAPPSQRPYLIVNFVSSADGRATVDGRSGPLGDDGDRALFHALCERVDAVLAGTSTLRIERYGRILSSEERRRRRVAAGLRAEPIACTITRSGRVPLEIPLFSQAGAQVIVFSGADPPDQPVEADVLWEPLDPHDPLPLTSAMRVLRERHGIETLLCEGGPTLFGALLAESLVDELFLTIAPKLAGGGDPKPITLGAPLPQLAPLTPIWLLTREGALFARYAVST